VLFYAGSRMQFVLFEITAMRETTVAPKWQRYAPVTWRWIGLKLLYLCIAGAVVLISAIPLVIAIIHLIHSGADMHGFHAVLRVMLQLLMPIALVGVTMMVMGLIYQMIVDFVMPVMALENASISESVSRAAGNLRGDVGGVLAYVLMRFVLGFGVGMATILAFALAVVAAGIPLVLIGAALFFGLHKAGITGHVLMGTGFGLEGLVGLGWLVFCCLALNGFVAFFNRAYSMYFYGGRYPALGAILEPVYAGILQAEPPPVDPPMPEPPPTPFS